MFHSKTHEEHLSALDEVLQRLTDNNMKINLVKYLFGNTEVSNLGFRLSPEGNSPGKDKLKAAEKSKNTRNSRRNLVFHRAVHFLQNK